VALVLNSLGGVQKHITVPPINQTVRNVEVINASFVRAQP
jgi:hypothetical protein